MNISLKIKKMAHFIKNKKAFAVDTAIKVLTAVVLGALVLTSLYGVMVKVVKPQTEGRIDAMYSYAGTGDLNGPFEGGTGDGGIDTPYDHDASNLHPGRDSRTIPKGGTYYVSVTSTGVGDYAGNTQTLTEGNSFPVKLTEGDVYVFEDYEYRYNMKCADSTWLSNPSQNGWGVRALDITKTTYAPILESINNMPVVNMEKTFWSCASLTVAPTIPKAVTTMRNTFGSCGLMESAPVIPDGVTNISSTFSNCTSLTTAPAIPNSVKEMNDTFLNCSSLIETPIIPNGITSMMGTFYGCSSLKSAPVIPDSVTKLRNTFYDCTSLVVAPVIPQGVTDMYNTFWNCTSLTSVSTIPNSVTNMSGTFALCTSLKGTIEINANLSNYSSCFFYTGSAPGCITLTGSSNKLAEIAATNIDGHVVVGK